MKKLTTLLTIALALTFTHCGPKTAEQKPIDPNYLEDGGFEYTFGIPNNFKVAKADLGATISYDPNPTVSYYMLYHGLTDALEGIPQAIDAGYENPLDVDDANIIRINDGSLTPSTEYHFAVEAFNSDGDSSGLTDVKSITVRDLIGTEVVYKAKLYACVKGDNRTSFTFRQGKMVFASSEAGGGGYPGQGGHLCEYEGVKLELQKIIDGQPTGPRYFFPAGADTKKIFYNLGEFIDLTDALADDFTNMVIEEPMTVGMNGEMRENCQGGTGLNKYRVKSRDGHGPVQDDDPVNTIEIDTSKCHKNNWTTFHTTRDNVIEFNLIFQTGE